MVYLTYTPTQWAKFISVGLITLGYVRFNSGVYLTYIPTQWAKFIYVGLITLRYVRFNSGVPSIHTNPVGQVHICGSHYTGIC